MTDLRAAAQQALEALELMVVDVRTTPTAYEAQRQAIAALRAALAAPVQEPVAWHYRNNAGASVMHWGPSAQLDADIKASKDYPRVHKVTPLYAAPFKDMSFTPREQDEQDEAAEIDSPRPRHAQG